MSNDIDSAELHKAKRAFQELFERMDIDHHEEAAAYYVLYISTFHDEKISLKRLLEKNKECDLSPGVTRPTLSSGRDELLNHGIIAEVLFEYERRDISKKFGQEAYIPAEPNVIWRSGMDLVGHLTLDDSWSNSIEALSDYYRRVIGKFGTTFGQEKVTLYYCGIWAYYMALYLCDYIPDTIMSSWISGIRSFEDISRYKNILNKGCDHRILLDSKFSANMDLKKISNLRAEYPEKLTLKTYPLVTTRRMTIIGEIAALDAIRILPFNIIGDKYLPYPAYIGNLYINRDAIDILTDEFNGIWLDAPEL